MSVDHRQAALDYHEYPVPGKIAVALTKPAETADDLFWLTAQELLSLFAKLRRALQMLTVIPLRVIWSR